MIRNDRKYAAAVARLDEEKARFEDHQRAWREQGFTDEQIERLMEPLHAAHAQLVEEVESYNRLKRGTFSEIHNLEGLGRALIGLRIFRGMSQKELAERLGVNESMVSRDERNEYHGVTVERAARILDALGGKLTTTVEADPEPRRAA